MHILVIDGQGGGLGAALVTRLKARLGNAVQIWAVGTNSHATSVMLKAGADRAATGENAVCYNVHKAQIVMGPLGLLAANSLMGEVSPAIAAALSRTEAKRILIPVSSTCGILVASAAGGKLEELLDNAVDLAAKEVEAK